LLNRYYPVCPTCAHDHDHHSCFTELHGFAGPLIAAAALHSFLDGWSVATAQLAVPLAAALHKVPEGVALGGILRASVKTRGTALGWAWLAEGATLVGGALGLLMAPHLGTGLAVLPRVPCGSRGVESPRPSSRLCVGPRGHRRGRRPSSAALKCCSGRREIIRLPHLPWRRQIRPRRVWVLVFSPRYPPTCYESKSRCQPSRA